MLLFIILILQPSSGSLVSALSGKSLEASTICMKTKHPCIPQTRDCSEKFYSTSVSLLLSIKQLLTMIDVNYASSEGSYKSFPGLQSAALVPKTSSYYSSKESPDFARFWTNIMGVVSGWASRFLTTDEYFQVGSSFPMKFEKMIISGRYVGNQYITSFTLNYSLDGFNWVGYKNSQIFVGSNDVIEPVEYILEPFIARSVRICPVTWMTYIAGHFEFYISQILYTQSLSSDTIILAVASGFKITSSSVYDNFSTAFKAGYDIGGFGGKSGSWCPAILDQNQWIMISSPRNVLWKRIGTMGDRYSDQRVSSYYITYTVDGSEWIEYKNKKLFQGNNDRSTAVEYDLEPFAAISIRIHPVTWTNYICLRVEAYCCEI